jgi:hypothetical protein
LYKCEPSQQTRKGKLGGTLLKFITSHQTGRKHDDVPAFTNAPQPLESYSSTAQRRLEGMGSLWDGGKLIPFKFTYLKG